MAELIETQIGNLVQTGAEERLGYRILQLEDAELINGALSPEACEQVQEQLWPICDDLLQSGEVATCYGSATFFYAHQIPRCAVRFTTTNDANAGISDIFVLDLTGPAVSEADALCGNGQVNEGESCDDGNHELWDGCDSHCEIEPFTGCETLIESQFTEAGVALVKTDSWEGPRSHLMVNQGTAMQPMSEALCDKAIATAQDTCEELIEQMPFVYGCVSQGSFSGNACSIRLEPYFAGVDAESGVFTTSLNGILAFTIR